MRLQHEHAKRLGAHDVERLVQKQEVVERFRHLLDLAGLLVGNLEHAGVHPMARERAAARCLALRALVLMMRKHQVSAAAMDVEGKPQVLARHGRALDVPAWAPLAPGGIPRRLARLGRLPQGEVERVAFARLKALAVGAKLAMARFHLVDVAAGKLAVSGVRAHAEVHVAFDLVGMPTVDELLHERDHIGNLARGARAHVGVEHASRVHVVDERLGVLGGHFCSTSTLFTCAFDNLVVDVGDILHERHVEAAPNEIAADHVEADERARVADVDAVVHGRAADVHADLAGLLRLELDFLAQLGVIDLNHKVPDTFL